MPTRFANTINGDPIYALRAMCDKNGLDFTQYYAKLTDLPAAQVQADWNVSDPTSMAFILNKPNLSLYALSSSLATVATSGSYNDLLDKPTIPAAQVQSDYGQTDNSAVDFIKNKPDLSVYAEKSELATVATTGDYDDLQNKPSIPAAQVQSDWSQSNSSAVDYIKNKPSNLVQDADYVHTDNNYTDADEAKLAGIEAGAEVNVQADWNQSDSAADDYIKNKPSIPAAQVQSDWNQSDNTQVDFIKNKPNIPAAQVQSDWSQSNSDAVDFIKNKPTINNVPAVESTDDGKVLKASYSGGVGAYSWENESGGGGSSNVMLVYGTSTWADFTAALATNSVIFCDIGDGKYAVMAWKSATTVEFQYVRTVNDSQWPLSSNGYNCEIYKYTLDNSNNWTTASYPVAFKPVTGNGIKLYNAVTNREVQIAVDIPVYTDGSNSILWLGTNGSLSIASSMFTSKSITKTYTSPKAGGALFTSSGSTSSTYFAIGNRYNNDCDQTFDNETIGITITGDSASSLLADRTRLIRWNSSDTLTINGDLAVKYGLFYYDTLQTSTPFKAAAEPKLIVELKDCGTLLAANSTLSVFMNPPFTKTVNNAVIPKGAKFLTAFYTVVGGVQYFFGDMLSPYGNANLTITSTMTGSVATLISVPASTSQDAGKLLGVNSSGDPEWQAAPTFTQEQADWNEANSSDPAYIKNKPTINNVPASTSADEGKVLTVDSSGNAVWDALATTAQIEAIVT